MKKEILGFILFGVIMVGLFIYGIDRFEKIDNGEIILVSQSEMYR